MHRDPYPAASILADLASTSLAVSPPAPDPVQQDPALSRVFYRHGPNADGRKSDSAQKLASTGIGQWKQHQPVPPAAASVSKSPATAKKAFPVTLTLTTVLILLTITACSNEANTTAPLPHQTEQALVEEVNQLSGETADTAGDQDGSPTTTVTSNTRQQGRPRTSRAALTSATKRTDICPLPGGEACVRIRTQDPQETMHSGRKHLLARFRPQPAHGGPNDLVEDTEKTGREA